jgi:hypothetical protein
LSTGFRTLAAWIAASPLGDRLEQRAAARAHLREDDEKAEDLAAKLWARMVTRRARALAAELDRQEKDARTKAAAPAPAPVPSETPEPGAAS